LRRRQHSHPARAGDLDLLQLLDLPPLWNAVGLFRFARGADRRLDLRVLLGTEDAAVRSLHDVRLRHPWQAAVPERGPRMGVNARNFEPSQLGNVRIRWLDGAVTEKYLE